MYFMEFMKHEQDGSKICSKAAEFVILPFRQLLLVVDELEVGPF
jgi:hypothetical protein